MKREAGLFDLRTDDSNPGNQPFRLIAFDKVTWEILPAGAGPSWLPEDGD